MRSQLVEQILERRDVVGRGVGSGLGREVGVGEEDGVVDEEDVAGEAPSLR